MLIDTWENAFVLKQDGKAGHATIILCSLGRDEKVGGSEYGRDICPDSNLPDLRQALKKIDYL